MRLPAGLVRRVVNRQATPTEVLAEVRSMAPLSAQTDPDHPWWRVDGDEILELLEHLASDSVFMNAQEAVRAAARVRARVQGIALGGVRLFRVLPVEQAERVVTESLVAEAMPAEMVEPTWDDELPELERFRLLAERQYLRRLMSKARWSVSAAAREAGVARQTIHALINRHGLVRPA